VLPAISVPLSCSPVHLHGLLKRYLDVANERRASTVLPVIVHPLRALPSTRLTLASNPSLCAAKASESAEQTHVEMTALPIGTYGNVENVCPEAMHIQSAWDLVAREGPMPFAKSVSVGPTFGGKYNTKSVHDFGFLNPFQVHCGPHNQSLSFVC
jgi:hypothetical protein